MSFLTGRGFDEVKKSKTNENDPISLTIRNAVMIFCVHIDIDNI